MKYPVLFPVSREFDAQTGSLNTASSATDGSRLASGKIATPAVCYCGRSVTKRTHSPEDPAIPPKRPLLAIYRSTFLNVRGT
jgi:hypothetical protein